MRARAHALMVTALVTKSSLTTPLKIDEQKQTGVHMITYSAEFIRDTIASNRSLPIAASQ